MAQLPRLFKPVDIETGYILNSKTSFFSVIVPEFGTNLINNPEVFDFNGYSSNVVATLNTKTNWGINSIDISMNVGDYIQYSLDVNLISSTPYTFSVYVNGVGKFRVYFVTAASVEVGGTTYHNSYNFNTRIEHKSASLSLTSGRIVIQALTAGTYNFSGFQLEAKEYATTFISGNQKGLIPNEVPLPYYWAGTPHRSPSVRLASTRHGGKIVNFKDFGLDVISFEGFGLPEFDNNDQQIAMRYGSNYSNTVIEDRDLTINGQFTLCDKETFFCNKGLLNTAFSPSLTLKQQPIKLQFMLMDCETPLTDCIEFLVHYKQGLDGNIENLYGEKVSIDFKMFNPWFYKCGLAGQEICIQSTISGTNIIGTNENNILTDMNGGTPLDELIRQMAIGSDNALYTVGDRPGRGVIVNRWEGSSWTVIGTAIDNGGNGYAIEAGYNNAIYVGGSFNGINGADNGYFGNVPPTMNLAKYDISSSTWSWIGNVQGTVYALEQLQDGTIAIGGTFNQVTDIFATTTNVANAAFYDPATGLFSTISGVGSGIGAFGTDVVYAIKQTPDGRIWWGGHFNFIYFGNQVQNVVYTFNDGLINVIQPIQSLIRRTNRNTTIPLNADAVYALEFDKNGTIYAAGYFDATPAINAYELTAPATQYANNIPFSVGKFVNGNWDSIGFFATVPPANAILQGNAFMTDIERDASGNLYFAGRFNYAGAARYANNINSPTLVGTLLNPIDNLSSYPNNTWGLTYYDGTKFVNNKILGAGTAPFIRTIKTGGYYSFSNYTSTYPNTLPFYTNSINSSPNAQNSFYIGGLIGTFSVACTELINLSCGDLTYPIITINGPGKLLTITNQSTNAILNFNKTLQVGELVTIDLSSPIPSVFSNFFGYQNGIIVRGSNIGNFVLLNGDNIISVLFDNTTINTNLTKVRINYAHRFWSLEEAICCEI